MQKIGNSSLVAVSSQSSLMICMYFHLQDENIQSHIGKTLGSVTYRDIWTDTAELLIAQVRSYMNVCLSAYPFCTSLYCDYRFDT